MCRSTTNITHIEAVSNCYSFPLITNCMYNILVPIDTNESRASLQVDAILDLPVDPDDIEVTLLHVFESEVPDTIWIAGGYSDEIEEELDDPPLPSAVEHAHKKLADAGISSSVEGRSGDPAEEILSVAEEIDCDSIFMGARRQSPIGKVIFGNVAQAVLLDSNYPVMVISEE